MWETQCTPVAGRGQAGMAWVKGCSPAGDIVDLEAGSCQG